MATDDSAHPEDYLNQSWSRVSSNATFQLMSVSSTDNNPFCLSSCVHLSASAAFSASGEVPVRDVRIMGGENEEPTRSPNTPGLVKQAEKTTHRPAGHCRRCSLLSYFHLDASSGPSQ